MFDQTIEQTKEIDMKTCIRFSTASLVFGALFLATTHSAFAYYLPGGSYVATCRHIRLGLHLEAFCQRVDGSWHYSRIALERCGGAGISNQNGHLSCGE